METATIIWTSIVIACTGIGIGYIVWDIKRFETRQAALLEAYKTDVNKQISEFKMRLDAQSKIHTDSLHRQNGALIYVTREDCEKSMAACPMARSAGAFTDLEKKLVEMGEKLATTRECFIEAVASIRTTVEMLVKNTPGNRSE